MKNVWKMCVSKYFVRVGTNRNYKKMFVLLTSFVKAFALTILFFNIVIVECFCMCLYVS